MPATLAPVAALLLSAAVLLMGSGLQGTLLPVRAQIEGFSAFSVGVLGSAYFAGFAAGCFLGPLLISRVGHIRTFATMSAVATACILAMGMQQEPLLWWLFRAVSGVCFAVLYLVIESWLNERATNETRGLVLSVYLIINLTVITIGQMLVTLASPATLTLFALTAILISLGAVPVALTRAIAPQPPAIMHPHLGRLFANSPVGFVGCLIVGVCNGSFWALSPLFAHGSGMDVQGIALFMSAAVIGGAVGQWPFGWLSDKMDRRRVILGCCLGAAIVAAALTRAPFAAPWIMLALAAAWGACAFSLYAISVAHSNDFAPAGSYVEVSSGLLLLFGIGAVVGPLIVAPLMTWSGPWVLYAATLVAHASLALYTLWRMSRRAPAPQDEHVPFDDSVQSAMTTSTVFIEDAAPVDEKTESDRCP